MPDEVTPALNPLQWDDALTGEWVFDSETYYRLAGIDLEVMDNVTQDVVVTIDGDDRQAAAALALFGQPFGFTHADVAALRLAIENLQAAAGELNWQPYPGQAVDALPGIAARIAALLPTEEEKKNA